MVLAAGPAAPSCQSVHLNACCSQALVMAELCHYQMGHDFMTGVRPSENWYNIKAYVDSLMAKLSCCVKLQSGYLHHSMTGASPGAVMLTQTGGTV